MEMSDIFVADAHIRDKDSECATRFINFLDNIKDSTRTLYLLGDLFDFWFGENNASFTRYQPILDKLSEIRGHGVDIVFIEGNHEAFMGPFFTDTLKAKVYPDDVMIELDGRKVYMTHGDTINHEEKLHLIWRRILKSRFLFFLMKSVPPGALLAISKSLSGASRNLSIDKKVFKEDIFGEFVNEKRKSGADTIIFAHTHDAVVKEADGVLIVNPGAFCGGSYAEYKDGVFSIRKFS